MARKYNSMTNLNGNILCAIDCETTGVTPGFHDVVQICFLPVDHMLNPMKDINPFYCELIPKRPENYSPPPGTMRGHKSLTLRAMSSGLEPYRAADMFDTWFEKLELPIGKRITPLAHNWPFDREFIIDWMGRESFNHYFDARYRDTMAIASYQNDCDSFAAEPFRNPKVSLTYLTKVHGIINHSPHDALSDCLATIELYRKLVLSK